MQNRLTQCKARPSRNFLNEFPTIWYISVQNLNFTNQYISVYGTRNTANN